MGRMCDIAVVVVDIDVDSYATMYDDADAAMCVYGGVFVVVDVVRVVAYCSCGVDSVAVRCCVFG